MSAVAMARVEELMQGWQPMEADSAMGRSMTSWTALSGSFMRPRTLTEPGVISRYFSISAGSAKDRRATLSCFDRSLVLKTFSPSSMSR